MRTMGCTVWCKRCLTRATQSCVSAGDAKYDARAAAGATAWGKRPPASYDEQHSVFRSRSISRTVYLLPSPPPSAGAASPPPLSPASVAPGGRASSLVMTCSCATAMSRGTKLPKARGWSSCTYTEKNPARKKRVGARTHGARKRALLRESAPREEASPAAAKAAAELDTPCVAPPPPAAAARRPPLRGVQRTCGVSSRTREACAIRQTR